MLHWIINWDRAFRDFFHLVHTLAEQNFSFNEFEVIYVQQRSREYADQRNKSRGLAGLADLELKFRSILNFRVIYLNQQEDLPYHLGICNNAGLAVARGRNY